MLSFALAHTRLYSHKTLYKYDIAESIFHSAVVAFPLSLLLWFFSSQFLNISVFFAGALLLILFSVKIMSTSKIKFSVLHLAHEMYFARTNNQLVWQVENQTIE